MSKIKTRVVEGPRKQIQVVPQSCIFLKASCLFLLLGKWMEDVLEGYQIFQLFFTELRIFLPFHDGVSTF